MRKRKWDLIEAIALVDLHLNKNDDDDIDILLDGLKRRATVLEIENFDEFYNVSAIREKLTFIENIVIGKATSSSDGRVFYDAYRLYLQNKKGFTDILNRFKQEYVLNHIENHISKLKCKGDVKVESKNDPELCINANHPPFDLHLDKSKRKNTQSIIEGQEVVSGLKKDSLDNAVNTTREMLLDKAGSVRCLIPWDEETGAIVLETLIWVLEGKIERDTAISYIAFRFRKKAKKEEIIHDISLQMSAIEYIYTDGKSGIDTGTVKTFRNVVEMYRNNRESYERLLRETKKKMRQTDSVQDDFFTWLTTKISKPQLSDFYILYMEIDNFCYANKILHQKLFETKDLSQINEVIDVVATNEEFQRKYKKNIKKMATAIKYYYDFIKTQIELSDRVPQKINGEKNTLPIAKKFLENEKEQNVNKNDSTEKKAGRTMFMGWLREKNMDVGHIFLCISAINKCSEFAMEKGFISEDLFECNDLDKLEKVSNDIFFKSDITIYNLAQRKVMHESLLKLTEFKKSINIPIDVLGLSERTCNCLKRANINTLQEIKNTPLSVMREIRGFGKRCEEEIIQLNTEDHAYLPTSFDISIKESYGIDLNYIKNRDLNEMNLSDHTYNCLSKIQITDFYQLIQTSWDELKSIKGFGRKCEDELRQIFEQYQEISKIYGDDKLVSEYIDNRLTGILKKIPEYRGGNDVEHYITVYLSNNKDLIFETRYGKQCGLNFREFVNSIDIKEPDELNSVIKFLNWCTFDYHDALVDLFNSILNKGHLKEVVRFRGQNMTLQEIGNIINISRERVRQIEREAKKLFSKWYADNDILALICADRNKDIVLTPLEVSGFFDNYVNEMLFLLKHNESTLYVYDSQLDVFVVTDDNMPERTKIYLDTLPDVFKFDDLQSVLDTACEDHRLTEEIVEKAIYEDYQLTGKLFHRRQLKLGTVYTKILKNYYPSGMHIYDDKELDQFRSIISEQYGDIMLPKNNRALSARIADVAILCGKGLYKAKENSYLSQDLIESIHFYIENNSAALVAINSIFNHFYYELGMQGVYNKYFLHGILRELFDNKYTFTRDYISKDSEVQSIGLQIEQFIKKEDYPVSKEEIHRAFPGISEATIAMAVSNEGILNYFGRYLHCTKLNFTSEDEEYTKKIVDNILADGEIHHIKEIYQYIQSDQESILNHLSIYNAFSLFSVLSYVFSEQFTFMRPYIAPLGVNISSANERLAELVSDNQEIEIQEIKEFCNKNNMQMGNILSFVNEFNDTHLLINANRLASIESIGINEEKFKFIEECIVGELNQTIPVRELKSISKFPQINYEWDEWLIYSMVKKWSTQLEVSTTASQFRYAVPIIALRGKMDKNDVVNSDGSLKYSKIDDLDQIDELLLDFTDDEIDELLLDFDDEL